MFRFITALTFMSAFFMGCANPAQTVISESEVNPLSAGLSVSVGPTKIPSGDALGDSDISVSNKYFALSFGVDTASPWGVARGGILDVAIIKNGELQKDFVSLIDFMPNYWSAWPSSYQRVEISQQSEERVLITTLRDWGEVTLSTQFEIRADSKIINIKTQMTNSGEQTLEGLTTGYISWPNGGHLFGMPGITEGDSQPISQIPSLGKWSAVYDEGWALGIFAPYSEFVAYTGRDRYLKHDLAPGKTREFTLAIQIESSANLSEFVQTEIDREELKAGRLRGEVGDAKGMLIAKSAVIVYQDQRLHSWALVEAGRFDFALPVGEYTVFAVAQGYAPGKRRKILVTTDGEIELNLNDVLAPSRLSLSVSAKGSNEPMDAMISITDGLKPAIKYFGQSRFFTELGHSGLAEFTLPPGEYSFEVSAAGGFISKPLSLDVVAIPGKTLEMAATIDMLERPSLKRWYSADLHHHSDVLDGFTPPEYVLRSQRAAGVDLAFLSDHDSVQNNLAMKKLAATQNMQFIAGTELSASWAHFNAYPLDEGKTVNPEVGQFSVQDIFSEARRLGAEIIHVNHPYGNYGYFDSLAQESEQGLAAGTIVPGGLDLNFDLIEVNSVHQPRTLERAWSLWNQAKPAYFAAGSDVHDVWSTLAQHSSGGARSFVYVEQELSVDSYVQALKAGHSYASQGPLIYPDLLFGTTEQVTLGERLLLSYELQSVAGLQRVRLIQEGVQIEEQLLSQSLAGELVEINFEVTPQQDTWYSLVVVDKDDRYAYSNPLWVKLDQ